MTVLVSSLLIILLQTASSFSLGWGVGRVSIGKYRVGLVSMAAGAVLTGANIYLVYRLLR